MGISHRIPTINRTSHRISTMRELVGKPTIPWDMSLQGAVIFLLNLNHVTGTRRGCQSSPIQDIMLIVTNVCLRLCHLPVQPACHSGRERSPLLPYIRYIYRYLFGVHQNKRLPMGQNMIGTYSTIREGNQWRNAKKHFWNINPYSSYPHDKSWRIRIVSPR